MAFVGKMDGLKGLEIDTRFNRPRAFRTHNANFRLN